MKFILSLFLVFYSYAIVRYHFCKNLDSTYFLFVLNKAIAWTASVSLGFSLFKQINNLPSRRFFGISAFFLAIIHILFSAYLSIENYNPSFYVNEIITVKGFFVLLSGGCSFLLMGLAFFSSKWPNKFPPRWIRYGKIAFLINFLHPVFAGIDNWVEFSGWPLFLPPITLLVTLINALLLTFYWKQKRGV